MQSQVKKSVLFFVVFFSHSVKFYGSFDVNLPLLVKQKKDDLAFDGCRKDKKSYLTALVSSRPALATCSEDLSWQSCQTKAESTQARRKLSIKQASCQLDTQTVNGKDKFLCQDIHCGKARPEDVQQIRFSSKKIRYQDLPQEIRDQIISFSGINDEQADRLPLQKVLARKKPSLSAVATLIACGANPNVIGRFDKQYPLNLAICSYRGIDCMNYKKIDRYNTIFSYLVRHGAKPELVNSYNRSCVHSAVSRCNTYVLAYVASMPSVLHCWKIKDHCGRDAMSIAQANLKELDIDLCDQQKLACIAVVKKTTLHMVQGTLKPVGKKKKK